MLVAAGLGVALAGSPGQRVVDLATRMVHEVGERPWRTVAGREAQRWVAAELAARGWTPRTVDGAVGGAVVSCRGAGRAPVVLFLAHTDTVPGSPGANDNAAAVASLLVLAGDLGETPRTVCLGFTDGEEYGLRGSWQLEADRGWLPGPLDQVVALDLVGRGQVTHNGLGPVWSAAQLRALLAAAPGAVPWVYRALSWGFPERELSDHGPFGLAGVPASHLLARGEGGVYQAYHSPSDLPDQLEVATLEQVQAALRGVAAMEPLPAGGGEAAFVVPWTTWVVPGWVTWLTIAGGLASAGVGSLGRVPLSEELRGLARIGAGFALAVGAAVAAVAVARAGRDPTHALTSLVVLAGWLAWAAAVVGWRPRWPDATGRRVAAAWVVVGTVGCVAAGLPLLAVPVAAGGVAVLATRVSDARSGSRWSIALRCLALGVGLWPAGYLLRADALRELAFHGMLPAGLWWVLWLVLPLPGFALATRLRGPRWMVVALLALGAAAVVAAWLSDPYSPPFLLRERWKP